MRRVLSIVIGAVVGIHLLASLASAAPPECGNKNCKAKIEDCVGSACGAFTGKELSRCKSGCKEMITGACMLDPAVCQPTTTTTTAAPTTTTEAPTTTSTEAPTTTTTTMGSPSAAFL